MKLRITITRQGARIDQPITETLVVDATKDIMQKVDPNTGEVTRLTLADLYRKGTLDGGMGDDFEEYIESQIMSKHPYWNRVSDIKYTLVKD